MASKSIKLGIIHDKQKKNQFKLAYIGSNVESYAYTVGNTGEGNLVFILDVQKGLQITEVPDDSDLQQMPDAKKPKTTPDTSSEGLKIQDAKMFPTVLSSYFKLKENKCRCHPNVATEFLLKFVVPEENAQIYIEPKRKPSSSFLKIGSNLGVKDKESSIKMDLRNLEQKGSYSIRNINLIVKSFCIPYSNISISDKGKIVIILDLQAGVEIKRTVDKTEYKAPNIETGTDMCLAYNDNMVRFIDSGKGEKALEFTLKLLIYSTNVLYIKDLRKFQQVMGGNDVTNVKNNSFFDYTALANASSNKRLDYFDTLFSSAPATLLYDDGNKIPSGTISGETLDYFNDPTLNNEPLTLGNKPQGQPPESGMFISKFF